LVELLQVAALDKRFDYSRVEYDLLAADNV
jgi:hypothetical protein